MSDRVSTILGCKISIWSVGMVCLLFSIWLFFPGSMSHDSWGQYYQALGLMPLDNWHPPMLVRLWQVCNVFLRGPELLFLLFIGVYWLGLTWTVANTARHQAFALLVIPLIGFFPPYFVSMSSVWKDAGTLAFLSLAFAACSLSIACERDSRWRTASVIIALLSLVLAIGLRHNAFTAAIPILAFLSMLWFKSARWRIASFMAFSLFLHVTTGLVNSHGVKRDFHLENVVLFWNLCGISLEEGRVVIPSEAFRVPEYNNLDSIRAYYMARECDGIVHQAKMYDPLIAEEEDRAQKFKQSALDTIWSNLGSFLKIRYEYTKALLWTAEGWPPTAYWFFSAPVPDVASPQNHYVTTTVHPRVLMHCERGLSPFVKARLFTGLPYTIISTVIMLLAIRFYWTSRRNYWLLLLALTISGTAYWMPYMVIGPSDHYRYLSWTVYSSVLAVYMLLNGWALRQRDSSLTYGL